MSLGPSRILLCSAQLADKVPGELHYKLLSVTKFFPIRINKKTTDLDSLWAKPKFLRNKRDKTHLLKQIIFCWASKELPSNT